MQVARDIGAIRRWRSTAAGPVGLVPTMGALHDGHMSLVAAARTACATVVASVFVNPLQFGPGEDLAGYPRDLEVDLARLRAAGVDAVFAPSAATFVGDDLTTSVSVAGVTESLEGASRPGHFTGVATIVAKLLNATQPAAAFFGEKDYQQLVTIRRMVRDLDIPVDIVSLPIVRDADGLALSSRNVYLSADERSRALGLSRALRAAADAWSSGSSRGDADHARGVLRAVLADHDGLEVDYAEVADEVTLAPLHGADHTTARALVAARIGRTRLIDNRRLEVS